MRKWNKFWAKYRSSGLLILTVVSVNLISSVVFFQIDLTEDKRFTLTPASKKIVEELDQPLLVEVLLEGKFPAEFRRLPDAVRSLLVQLKKINPQIQFRFTDPLDGTPAEVKERLEEWAKVGIVPTELSVRESDGQTRKRIYPFVFFYYGDRQIAVQILEETSGSISGDLALNNSISLLEYKFVNSIVKLRAESKPNILFTSGHGELNAQQTLAWESNLRPFYNTGRVNPDSIYHIPEDIELVIVPKPTMPFSEKNLFVLDQFVMNGGDMIFLVDPLNIALDSIQKYGQYVPVDNATNLDDLLFKYGLRVNKNLVMDLECTSIPLTSGRTGGQSQYSLFPWYYHILAQGFDEHPIVKGLDRVNLFFPASIDTIKTKRAVKKTPLLSSSPYSKLQFNPVLLDFEILKSQPDNRRFQDGPQIVAYLLEGELTSLFENRVPTAMQDVLKQLEVPFRESSTNSRIMVVSDGDVAKNLINPNTGEIRPLGFNQYMNYTFDNQDFLTNAVEYVLDNYGLSQTRAKSLKLRLLDQQKIKEERLYWQLFNVLLPVVILSLGGLIYSFWRRWSFSK